MKRMFTKVKTDEQVALMREGGQMLASVLQLLKKELQPGMTTKEAALLAGNELKRLGGEPAFLHYPGGPGAPDFPDVLCVSVNEEVVHGVPKEQKQLQNGDVVSVDFGVRHKGLVTDAATTFIVGTNENGDVARLLDGTKQALEAGIDYLHDGVRVGDVAAAIERVLKKHGLGIVRELVGHGIGEDMHEEPNLPNYGTAGTGEVLNTGMTICLEPMAMLGSEQVGLDKDGWTIVTADGSLAAHFEHTILITDTGGEVLTTL